MVGTRWESSNRPLFVRTVWKDGHHHVVLRKDEEISTQTARSGRRKTASSRSAKKITSPASETSTNFKVSSVKLLLESLRNIKNENKSKRCKVESRDFVKRAITVDITPSDSVRYSDLNKQVSFQNEKKRPKFTIKSNSVEVNNFYDERDAIVATPPPFSYDNYCMEQYNTSLSERVMIWLDLAIQNQKQFKNVELKKRVMTAQVERNTSLRNIELNNSNNIRIVEEKNVEEPKNEVFEVAPLVTSHVERNQLNETEINEEKFVKVRTSTAKRQLHIFLPNLPRKCSESGSFLSSKSNSTLLQTN